MASDLLQLQASDRYPQQEAEPSPGTGGCWTARVPATRLRRGSAGSGLGHSSAGCARPAGDTALHSRGAQGQAIPLPSGPQPRPGPELAWVQSTNEPAGSRTGQATHRGRGERGACPTHSGRQGLRGPSRHGKEGTRDPPPDGGSPRQPLFHCVPQESRLGSGERGNGALYLRAGPGLAPAPPPRPGGWKANPARPTLASTAQAEEE